MPSFLFSASTIYISSSALLHCQFQSILASVGEKKAYLFSHLKSLYGFTVNVGSVIYCWPVLYTYVGNLDNSQWFSVSFQQFVMLPFFPYTATVSTKPTDNPACGGVLPERMMGIALRSPRHSPSHHLLETCSHLFVCLALMQKNSR